MRQLRWLFILFQIVWLNAFLPGHTRGQITVPGFEPTCHDADTVASGSKSCCVPGAKESGGKHTPTPAERAHCAVCYMAAGLTVATAIDLTAPPLGLAGLLDRPAPEEVSPATLLFTYDSTGPPNA